MKLKIRYDGAFQTIDLDAKATHQMWVSLSLQGEELTETEKEIKIQEAFDEQYNRPEYNNWHKYNRHIDPTPKKKRMNGKRGYIQAEKGDTQFDIMDYLLTTSDEDAHLENIEYKEVCDWIRCVCGTKKNWADAFIAVRMDGMGVNDYAAMIGVSDASIVSKYLARAEKKLREKYPERQI